MPHSEIKAKMKGVTGFREDSDYSLCLRFLMFHMCEALEKSDPDFRLTVLVEDGPWGGWRSGAVSGYKKHDAGLEPGEARTQALWFWVSTKGKTTVS